MRLETCMLRIDKALCGIALAAATTALPPVAMADRYDRGDRGARDGSRRRPVDGRTSSDRNWSAPAAGSSLTDRNWSAPVIGKRGLSASVPKIRRKNPLSGLQ